MPPPAPSSTKERARRYHRGLWAEHIAMGLLVIKGYRILTQRWRTPVGEIDLLARHGTTLVVVEVKERTTLRDAAESIAPYQQTRLLQAARYALQNYPAETVRCDAILIAPWRWPHHIINAWGEG